MVDAVTIGALLGKLDEKRIEVVEELVLTPPPDHDRKTFLQGRIRGLQEARETYEELEALLEREGAIDP